MDAALAKMLIFEGRRLKAENATLKVTVDALRKTVALLTQVIESESRRAA